MEHIETAACLPACWKSSLFVALSLLDRSCYISNIVMNISWLQSQETQLYSGSGWPASSSPCQNSNVKCPESSVLWASVIQEFQQISALSCH